MIFYNLKWVYVLEYITGYLGKESYEKRRQAWLEENKRYGIDSDL